MEMQFPTESHTEEEECIQIQSQEISKFSKFSREVMSSDLKLPSKVQECRMVFVRKWKLGAVVLLHSSVSGEKGSWRLVSRFL